MKILQYAGGQLRTGDEIATALLEYSAALAEAGTAGTVEIPVLSDDGRRVTATLLVGPASQIVLTDSESSGEELVDEYVLAGLRARTRGLHPAASVLGDDDVPFDDDYE